MHRIFVRQLNKNLPFESKYRCKQTKWFMQLRKIFFVVTLHHRIIFKKYFMQWMIENFRSAIDAGRCCKNVQYGCEAIVHSHAG